MMSFLFAAMYCERDRWGIARMHFLRVLLLSLIVVVPQAATAQQQDVFKLFGGMIKSGIAAATQADWERLPNSEVACVDATLRQQGSSINDMVRQGVSPSDSRMAGFRNQCRAQANPSGPSFDCRRARYADEITVCGDPELARLDRLIGQGYQDLLLQMGEGAARSVAAPLLAARRACGADAGCIKNAQISAIRELQRRGAAIADAEATPPARPVARPPMAEAIYTVDGMHLGGRVALGSPSYLEYRCNPSDQFVGLTWCQKRRQEASPRGAYSSITTIVHADDGTALYVNRYLEPAFFAGTEAMDDVRRLSAKYGEPRFIAAPAAAVGPRTLMATWGEVSLQPLDRARLADLAAGRDIRAGILVDHIGNFQRSASMGLPVYRVTGGAGYVWAASWDPAGRGTLRFLTIDPSRLLPGTAAPDVASDAASPQVSLPTAESLSPAPAVAASPPALRPTTEPSPAAPSTRITSAPESVQQPAPPLRPAANESLKETSSSAAPTPAPTYSTLPAVAVADANAKAESPANYNRTPPAPKADVTPRPAAIDAPASKPAPVAEQPRVVGPPIAIQPVAPTSKGGNSFEWILLAAVALLLGAVGFLLLERRKRTVIPQEPVAAAAGEAANHMIAHAVGTASEDDVVHMAEPEPAAITMQEPPPLPIALSETPSATPMLESTATGAASPTKAGDMLQANDSRPASNIVEHPHFGIWLLVGLVAISALMSGAVGLIGLIPLALSLYLLPTIIAFKVRHHYAWPLAAINVVFGFTVLGWLGIFVWALIGPRKSALDGMAHHSALGLSKTPTADPALRMSDYDLRSGWKMPVVQAEIFSFAADGAPVESADSIKVFFKNPVIGICRSGGSSSEANSVRYNATTQIRCVAKIAAETKLRVGRTLGRTALTGIGAAILTGREGALGAAFLDYRFGGDEADEVVAALIVLSDYSSLVVQSESQEFEKFCALLPSHLLSEELAIQTAEEIDRIKRMAADGPRVLEEMRAQIAETEKGIANFAQQAETGTTFAERDEGRIGQLQAEERLINERAVLNAVDRLIKLASTRELPGRKIA
jgi:hypothetical protein